MSLYSLLSPYNSLSRVYFNPRRTDGSSYSKLLAVLESAGQVVILISPSVFLSTRSTPVPCHVAPERSDFSAYQGVCGLLPSDPNVLPKCRPILSEAPPVSLSARSNSNGGSPASPLPLAGAQGLFSVLHQSGGFFDIRNLKAR